MRLIIAPAACEAGAVEYDPRTKRATGVRFIDTNSKKRTRASARLVFLNAGAFNSVHVLLNSATEAMPDSSPSRSR